MVVVVVPRQDAAPLPYGGLDYYQVHYIVETGDANTEQFMARCEPITKGRFGDKRVVGVKWTGTSSFADTLQNDMRLTDLLKEVMLEEGEIRVDPLDDHVRIYGKWKHNERPRGISAMAEVADVIAGHIKAMVKP
jgi:hypothetical protein